VRILCAPVFLWMLLADAGADGPLRWWAAVLFIVAIATDGIDGYLARKYEIVTDLGKLLDPIADKALTGCAFVGLSILAELPWWVTIARPGARSRHHGASAHRRERPRRRGGVDGQAQDRRAGGRALLALLPLWTWWGTGSTS
jgi:CDP-diacylglycerol--glycerol-3-phosphate 3-phosphatidyltransferase